MSARTLSLAGLLACAGCSFDRGGLLASDDADARPIDAAGPDGIPRDASPFDATPVDAASIDASTPDAEVPDAHVADAGPPIITDDVAHVQTADEYGGTADIALGIGAQIDTSALTITGGVPPGASFDAAPQDGGGPELAILHVDDLAITGPVRVIGTRPLVVIASGSIAITSTGALEAGGRRNQPGAGGDLPGAGAAPGLNGQHTGTFSDGGGGGGGHATNGGVGGTAACGIGCEDAPGGAGGGIVGDASIPTLRGGSGGGAPPPDGACAIPAAGAGGGAIQLYAAIAIQLDGRIQAGGGGGGSGEQCSSGNYSAASGGGSGGAIYLQAPALASSGGSLFANGGGGGGSAGTSGDGTVGTDAGTGTSTPGGPGGGNFSAPGGAGGGSALDAQPGGNSGNSGNGGGGGGSAGRLAIRTQTPVSGIIASSPAISFGSF